jgi:hypothetical protein
MTDQTIVRIAAESKDALKNCPWHMEINYLIPAYNGLIRAARANHPDDLFLAALEEIKQGDSCNAPELCVLYTQLRIAVESLMAETSEMPTLAGNPSKDEPPISAFVSDQS